MSNALNKIGTILAGGVLLVFLWLICLLFSLYALQPRNIASVYTAPENAEVIVNIDGRDVLKRLLTDVLLEGKGDDLFNTVKTLPEQSSPEKQYGINWAQPVTYFKAKHNGKELQGLIVQVINPVEWNRNINTLLGNTSVAKHQGQSGIVVHSGELTKEELYAFIDRQKSSEGAEQPGFENGKLMAVRQWSEDGNAEFTVSVDKNIVSSQGIINHGGILKSNQLSFILKPDGFHFTSDLVTKELNDTLAKYIGIDLPLTGISVNYRGITLSETDGKSFLSPDGDFVFGFERETSVQQVVEAIPNAVWEEENKTVKLGKQVYFIKQLDAKTIFFGVNKNAELSENSQAIGVLLTGSLKPLFTIKGSRLIRAALRLNPVTSFGLDLSEEIQLCSIRLKAVSSTSFQLDASFRFRNEDDAILKLAELVLKRQV